ncbi:unnamed protein product [Scytosiphon promiscuus]
MAPPATCKHDRQHTLRRRRPPTHSRSKFSCSSNGSKRRSTLRRGSPTFASLSVLVAACLCCWYGRTPAVASAAATPGTPLTLRVRMPDGAVKRVKATTSDTVDVLLGKLGMGGGDGGGEGLSTNGAAGSATAEGSASVAALGLGNGDFLYVKSDSAARAAAKSKLDALERMKAAAAGTRAGRGSTFVPFPEHARPPPPRAAKRIKTWQDIEATQAQTFSLKPQKDSNVKKISVEQSAMDDFVGYLKKTGLGKHRCALLFGRVSPSTGGVKVEAMYEPPQKQPQGRLAGVAATASGTYDSSALLEAARVAVAAATTGQDGAESVASGACATGSDAEAAAEVGRAVRVAGLLGLRLVGWCLSHDKREHFMAANDVVTASALQLMSMAEKGKEEGVLVATVTVPVNVTDGEVATEAFSVSNQTVQMYSEGLLGHDQPDPTADKVKTTAVVKEGGKETRTPETLGLICNVAIVQHEGVLQTRFPPANRGKSASISDLQDCLFGMVQDKRTPASKPQKQKQKQPSFLKRLSDFQLLVFLSRQMGFSKDFEELCAVVQKRDGRSPALDKLKVVLENLCDRD